MDNILPGAKANGPFLVTEAGITPAVSGYGIRAATGP